MGLSHKEFLIVLLRFTLVDKLNNESQLDEATRRGKWAQWRRGVKTNVNWRFIDSPINRGNCSTCRTPKWNPNAKQNSNPKRIRNEPKPLEGDATVVPSEIWHPN